MSEMAMAGDALSRIRTERVHTTMLIELLALLVFMSMAFAFVFREEGDRANPWKEKAVRLEQQLTVLQKENGGLKREIASLHRQMETLEASIRRLVAAHSGPLQPNDWVTIPLSEVSKGADQASNAEAMADELRRENQRLRAQLQAAHGKGGTDLPNCPVTAGFLLKVDVFGDGGFRVTPAWNAGAQDAARRVPGVVEITSGASLDRARFAALASRISDWGRSQAEPCGFRAKVTEHHGDLGLYKRQVAAVEQFFYVRRN